MTIMSCCGYIKIAHPLALVEFETPCVWGKAVDSV